MLWDLFWTFARMGVLTYGGGYAMLPILQREVVENKKWATEEEILDYYALGQCTPGIIAVNVATFVGSKKRGVLGGIVATLGVVFPSVVIITAIAAVLRRFADLPIVQHAFAGIRVSVLIMVLDAAWRFFKRTVRDLFSWILFISVAVLTIAAEFSPLSVSPVLFVLLAAVCGLLFGRRKENKK